MACVVIRRGNEELHRQELAGAVLVGRQIDCDLWVNDPFVSRHHCRLEPVHAGQWRVRNLNSRNGVVLRTRLGEEEPVLETRLLADGDVLEVGGIELLFLQDEPATLAAPTTPVPPLFIDVPPQLAPQALVSDSTAAAAVSNETLMDHRIEDAPTARPSHIATPAKPSAKPSVNSIFNTSPEDRVVSLPPPPAGPAWSIRKAKQSPSIADIWLKKA